MTEGAAGGRDLRAAVGLLVFFATLPLQWQVLADTPVGILRIFHLGAIALLLIAPPSVGDLRAMARPARPLPAALGLMLLLLAAMALVYDTDWSEPLRQALYAFTGLAVAVTVVQALGTARGRRLLALALPVSMLSWLLSFVRTMLELGIDPGAALEMALGGNPDELLFFVFRPVFETGNESNRSQIRHEVFAALLVAAYVTWIAVRTRLTRVLAATTTVVLVALLFLSLSRAIVLAAVLVPVLGLVRAVVKLRITAVFAVCVAAVIAAVAWAGQQLFGTFEARLSQSASYEGRVGAIADLPPEEWAFRLLLGGGRFGLSTHTMILDAALRGGVMAAVAALVVVAVIAGHTLRAAARYLRSSRAADLAAFGCGALVLVRCFTAGGGLLHLVEWTAFGVLLAVEMRQRADDRPAPHGSAATGGPLSPEPVPARPG